jgi:hypothetical protein
MVAVGLVAVTLWIIADTLIQTDEERLEVFIEDVTGPIDRARIDRALRWVDPGRQPVEVDLRGRHTVYGGPGHGAEAADVAEAAQERLAPWTGVRLRVLSRAIEVDGEEARVRLRVLSQRGPADVEYALRRHGERWWVRRIRIR